MKALFKKIIISSFNSISNRLISWIQKPCSFLVSSNKKSAFVLRLLSRHSNELQYEIPTGRDDSLRQLWWCPYIRMVISLLGLRREMQMSHTGRPVSQSNIILTYSHTRAMQRKCSKTICFFKLQNSLINCYPSSW